MSHGTVVLSHMYDGFRNCTVHYIFPKGWGRVPSHPDNVGYGLRETGSALGPPAVASSFPMAATVAVPEAL